MEVQVPPSRWAASVASDSSRLFSVAGAGGSSSRSREYFGRGQALLVLEYEHLGAVVDAEALVGVAQVYGERRRTVRPQAPWESAARAREGVVNEGDAQQVGIGGLPVLQAVAKSPGKEPPVVLAALGVLLRHAAGRFRRGGC